MDRTTDVDGYIESAPGAAQPILRELRRIIRAVVPEAIEKLGYGMPSYEYRGQRLVHFAAARAHVGVYGLVHVEREVPRELAEYLDHRSTLHFRFDRPLPVAALTAALEQKVRALSAGDRPGVEIQSNP